MKTIDTYRTMHDVIYLAPIMGVTTCAFRNIYTKYFTGLDKALTPFISVGKHKKLTKVMLRELDPERNQNLYVIPQVLGNNAEEFINLANKIYDAGYETVNWNMGCPFPMVVNKGRGSGLLPQTDFVKTFLDTVIPALNGTLSVKTRLGLKQSDDILKLIPVFNDYPLDEVIIHPRTGKQMYTGTVDLDRFEECLGILKHKTVYNGDIVSVDDFTTLKKRFTTISDWMIGRGILRNPFLAEEIKTGVIHPYEIKKPKIKALHDDLLEFFNGTLKSPAHVLDKMKGIWVNLHYCVADGEKMFKEIKKAKLLDKYVSIVYRYLR